MLMLELEAGGKPSTWFPPGGLVEHQKCNQNFEAFLSYHPEKYDSANLKHITPYMTPRLGSFPERASNWGALGEFFIYKSLIWG